jgi:hypothetical protein
MLRFGAATVAALLVLEGFAFGHADSEVTLATIPDPAGGTLRLARRRTDGVMVTDPCRLVIYDEAGRVVDRTPLGRGMLIGRGRDGIWRAFEVEMFSWTFRRAWALRGRRLVPDRSRAGFVEGVRLLVNEFGGYWLASALVCAAGVVTSLRKARRVARENSDEFQATGCGCLAWFWMFVMFMYSPLSLPPVLVLGLALSLPWMRGGTERRQVAALFGVPLAFLLLLNAIDVVAMAFRS